MSESKNPLPEFENPPVIEVALRVQFREIGRLNAMQIGTLWQRSLKGRFPTTEEHPALDRIEEHFGPSGGSPGFRLQVGPPSSRFWFQNDEGTELLQIQRDCFAHNWRKRGQDMAYPRFPGIKQTFMDNLKQLESFLSQESLGDIVPNQCEVTYMNELASGSGWSHHGELCHITPLFGATNGEFLPQLENSRLSLGFVMYIEGREEPVGRLHITIAPTYRIADHVPVYLLTLIARGAPIGDGMDGVSAFLDLGHQWIVRGFSDVTTTHMHGVWRRKR